MLTERKTATNRRLAKTKMKKHRHQRPKTILLGLTSLLFTFGVTFVIEGTIGN